MAKISQTGLNFYQKSPIDSLAFSNYNIIVKRFIVLFLLVLTLSFCGCSANKNDEQIKLPAFDQITDEVETEDDTQQDRKKKYAVSNVNGLRLRTSANTTSQVLGNLDKNDAVLIIDEKGEFYQTVYKEKTAFVYKDYCSVMEIDYASEEVEKAIDLGCSLLGYPYVWGSERYHWGNGKLNANFRSGEFDCSAFTQYVYYLSNSVILDVTTRTQVNNGQEVELKDLKRGDLMFFTNQSRQNKVGAERIGHVAIYFGNNYILHTASDHAVIEPISSTRWNYYITSRRVV